MKNQLFDEFFVVLNNFIEICKNADSNLSEGAVKNKQPTAKQQDIWNDFTANLEKQRNTLKQLVYDRLEKNKEQVDITLSTFRQLSKRMDYIDYSWSKSQNEIQEYLNKLSLIRYRIDVKYNMGDEKYRKKS